MAGIWHQVYETKLFQSPTDSSNLRIRVSATPDLLNVIIDMRKYNGEKGTRLGVGLFPDEMQWFFEVLQNSKDVERQFDYRKIRVEYEVDFVCVKVLKKDGNDQIMYLSMHMLGLVLKIKHEIEEAINEGMLLIKKS